MSSLRTISIQLSTLAVLLLGVEWAARVIEPLVQRPVADLQLAVQPYMMFTAPNRDGSPLYNKVKNEPVQSTMRFNNFGFAESFDFQLVPAPDYLEQHRRHAGEKLVLLTGGSAAAGHGATANDKTIASRMERYLNGRSRGPHYRVVNLAMSSWSSYQEFIGLSLFGLPLDPDWIVVMDGVNDGSVACSQGGGAGHPMEWAKFLYFAQYGGRDRSASEVLLRHSALLRLATGLKPAPPPPSEIFFDESEADKRFELKVAGLTIAEQDRQIEFYLQSQRNMLALFHRSNVILSTQPQLYDNAVAASYRAAFGPNASEASRAKLRAELDQYMDRSKDDSCSSQGNSKPGGYFIGRSSLRLMELAAHSEREESPARTVVYYNTESVFSLDLKKREPNFMDNVHMSDRGQDRIADFYADAILSAERGAPLDLRSFTKDEAEAAKVPQ